MPKTLALDTEQGELEFEFHTLTELAEECGRSKVAFFKLMERGIIPDANIRGPRREIKRGSRMGEHLAGPRYYTSYFIVPKLVEIFAGITGGRKITDEQRLAIKEAFEQEREYIKNPKNFE